MQLQLRRKPKLAEFNRVRAHKRREELAALPYKRCGFCQNNKDRNEFGKQSKTFDRLSNRCIACTKEQNKLYLRRLRVDLRAQVFTKYGKFCTRCGFIDERALQIDHVHGNAREDNLVHRSISFYRKVLRDLTGAFQILCANCNWIKRLENNEAPHSR